MPVLPSVACLPQKTRSDAADFLYGLCEGVGSGEGVGACEGRIGHVVYAVDSEGKGVSQHVRCLRRAHRDRHYFRIVLLLREKSLLQRKLVKRVGHGIHGLSVESSLLKVPFYLGLCIRNLFYAHYNLHSALLGILFYLPWYVGVRFSRKAVIPSF